MTQFVEAARQAQALTRDTLLPGDKEKYAAYLALSYDEKVEWYKREGHAEICRLQRLIFWGFI